ncbi:DUF1707 domain-containing protein [Streptomyces bambusae]|uniref:DUF1707 SHOCT-like domain-containing protein n=1 Tax=Streptomyces bambusae TaxID=1550616 RepID=UPI001CFE7F86|nr:DUF1707 domain-containing protein [Streptomyces bambusae]MCB5167236.1 DUF1707 domain-containing protein [Streptomyces bambusae]
MTDDLPQLRASDADREHVVERLREAVAEGRLDMDEFEERMTAAYASRTYADLEPLTRDLPGERPGPVSLVKTPGTDRPSENWPARIGGQAGSSLAVAVMGGFERKGAWTVPARLNAVAFWGGGTLDLREAHFETREVVINCVAIMGGVEIVVPPGVDVQIRGIGIMGGFGEYGSAPTPDLPVDPRAPRVVVTGFAFWGGVDVKRKGRKGGKGE